MPEATVPKDDWFRGVFADGGLRLWKGKNVGENKHALIHLFPSVHGVFRVRKFLIEIAFEKHDRCQRYACGDVKCFPVYFGEI